MRRLLLAFTVAVLALSSAWALDVKDGRIRLVVEDRTGRFAVYFLENVAKNTYIPLLYADETRTTYPTVAVDDKYYKLGESGDFRVTVTRNSDGSVRSEYKSSFCVVRMTYKFVRSPGASMTDGVSISFELENVARKDSSIGLRFLLDTWLGEKLPTHFVFESAGALGGEVQLSGDFKDQWLRSQPETTGADKATLQVQLKAPATVPSSVAAANWKRINDTAWSFESIAARSFTMLPYSINDSAVALYYDPVALRPGAARTIQVILSQATEGYTITEKTVAVPATISDVAVPAATDPLGEMTDLLAVRAVIDAINAAMSSGRLLSDAEMASLEATLKRLEERKGKY